MVIAVPNDVSAVRAATLPKPEESLADKFRSVFDKAKDAASSLVDHAATAIERAKAGTSNPLASVAGGAEQAGKTISDPESQIARLNTDGDQLVMAMTAEGKLQLPIEGVPIGVKGQYGFSITVKQVGDEPAADNNGQKPHYDVTFDKNLLGGAMVEAPVPGVDPAFELNARTTGSVTMRFDSQQDAARAVQTLQKLAAAEAVRDGGNAATKAINPLASISNPFSNPVTDNGNLIPGLGDLAAKAVEPSQEDRNFLRDHVTSYSERLGLQERGKVAVKFANLGIEPRLDNNQWITRTVQLPQNGQLGRLTYTLSGDLSLSAKEKLTIGKQEFDQLEIGYVPQNIVDHGRFSGEVSLSWDLPANGSASTTPGKGNFSALPELSNLGAPDRLSANLRLDYQTQGLADLSRTDINRLNFGVTVDNPTEHAGSAVNSMLHGDLQSAFGNLGDDLTVTARNETLGRDGVHQQHEIGIEVADVVEGKVSLEGDIGLDDVTSRRTATFTGTEIAKRLAGPDAEPPAAPQGPAPSGDAQQSPAKPDQVVVVPHDGLNVRETPDANGQKVSAFQHGTFLQPTGNEASDRKGNRWVEVTGTDVNDRPVQGWVNGSYVTPHKAGAMDATGRIDPELEADGYREHTVKPGNTIWDIAKQNGVDFDETVRLNSDHLIDPNMIFPGDTIYIPGTAKPGGPTQPAQPQPPVQPQQPSSSAPSAGSAGSPSAPSISGSSAPSAPSTESAPSVPATPAAPSVPSDSNSTSEGSGSDTPVTQAPPRPANPQTNASGRADLGKILHDYQMPDDPGGMVQWEPGAPLGWFTGSKRVTATESEMLNKLSPLELRDFNDIANLAEMIAKEHYPAPRDKKSHFTDEREFNIWGANDGHMDAFRHTYWNALMTERFGAEFTKSFTNAHEGVSGNPADREAMDIYNNSVGRRIAQEHPNASPEQLVDLVQQAMNRGELVVIDRNGDLAWSDKVSYGEHGVANDGPAPGVMAPADANARTAS
ncbi:hypothetical protein T281_06155 [Rhodomicrobium udaipurense JA643]|uniref:LysM peptidoglycan-binding domain-containing protein n=1 Tax=Rhodomicrobium udaipurense TaxID=1202716 RepID=A0A8I1GCB5_9HYPH|nr:LysM peptidoglycan-binding domain-containing protein [Rhodomicrobium udaipurense]KAI95292.1 hypothetical protein T281_06155 [Rhodomicrobium udaipurense JA643]MBJ7544457.1 LysM peptidoglycan-binding domain-containing protein [Rhodomicrobium udaipurense]